MWQLHVLVKPPTPVLLECIQTMAQYLGKSVATYGPKFQTEKKTTPKCFLLNTASFTLRKKCGFFVLFLFFSLQE